MACISKKENERTLLSKRIKIRTPSGFEGPKSPFGWRKPKGKTQEGIDGYGGGKFMTTSSLILQGKLNGDGRVA